MKRSHSQSCLALVGLVVLSVGLATGPSCTVPQLQRGDRIAADVNAVGTALRDIAGSPAVPSPMREILEILGIAGVGGYGIWQRLRASKILEKSEQKSLTLTAIADGVDQAPPEAAAKVKTAIQTVMMQREILSTANTIVDEHRSKLTS